MGILSRISRMHAVKILDLYMFIYVSISKSKYSLDIFLKYSLIFNESIAQNLQ